MEAFLDKYKACPEGRAYAYKCGTLERTWNALCTHPGNMDWLVWLACAGTLTRRQRVDFGLRWFRATTLSTPYTQQKQPVITLLDQQLLAPVLVDVDAYVAGADDYSRIRALDAARILRKHEVYKHNCRYGHVGQQREQLARALVRVLNDELADNKHLFAFGFATFDTPYTCMLDLNPFNGNEPIQAKE